MVKHHYGLPSLKMIGTFEAAGRLKSFKDAADELHVTPGAVSHQIRSLEQELDMKLFLRESRAVNLTPEGKDLFEVVSSSLNEIGQNVEGCMFHVRISTCRGFNSSANSQVHRNSCVPCGMLSLPRLGRLLPMRHAYG